MKNVDFILDTLSFTFYSPDEIRKLAVKEITSLISIEPTLGKWAINGLYDAQLGSISDREPCRNCGLSFYDCNGHYGRIEFAKPVYHPILFDNLFKLIKGCCFYCHRLSYHQGLNEVIFTLGNKGITDFKKYSDLDEIQSNSKYENEKLAVKVMSQQLRRLCEFCRRKPLVFSKSRKCEILVHISSKKTEEKFEPENKKRKLEEPAKIKSYECNYTDDELYGIFTDVDVAVTPEILREHLRMLWIKEHENLKLIFPMLQTSKFEYPTDVFFMENMLINPPMNRLPAIMGGDQMIENPETTNLCSVVRSSATLLKIINMSDGISKSQHYQNIRESVLELQKRVNVCFDSNMHRDVSGAQPGLRQKIDKKEGLFRQNIMGKRVNFACRSVISPDPNIGLNEIGVPVLFLSKLVFPEPMNSINKDFLKQCLLNGPDVYPGAISYQMNNEAPVAIGKNGDSIAEYLDLMLQMKNKVIVNRHAMNGDVLIMNRQPTLHRPSMQAHVIKAINDPRAKTLRMHYSNCKAYNADFDGDEMNGHYPQSILAQSEAKLLVNVCHQHSTPKDGSPLAGLIQDHVIAGTRICMRDCFLGRREAIDLISFGLKHDYTPPLRFIKPAIMKPKKLWTGKQILTMIIINCLPKDAILPNMFCPEPKKNSLWKISQNEQKLNLSDVELIIVEGYVCTGIFDKAHIGPSSKGLINSLRLLYGSEMSLQILTCISRCLNRFLIYTGFSTGIKDGFLNKDGDDVRNNIKNKMRAIGLTSITKTFNIDREKIDLKNVADLMEKAQFDKSDEYRNKMSEIDVNFKSLSLNYINKLVTSCKENLLISFPKNNLSFMSNTGAKGGESNVTKIAIGLGAIEIEGKRCPLTVAGRTLPSFRRYDFDPASRGFCTGRFTSGLSPTELFFESMAGRDGLVDTAVKTSSSGYLQRCLIKHLEDITVCYDGTVRDNMHNIIQFRYGYDGLDVINSVTISQSDHKDFIHLNLNLFKKKYLRHKPTMTDEEAIEEIVNIKKELAQVSPGEAVGLLAAQSIGEPSTQMTLNTFHNAGQSEMNVTLGIPRLREILMCGSEKINTPSMKIPILKSDFAKKNLAIVLNRFNKLLMKDVIRLPLKLVNAEYYEITFQFKKEKNYKHITDLNRKDILSLIEKTFFKSLAKTLKKYSQTSKIEIVDTKDDDDDDEQEHGIYNVLDRNDEDGEATVTKKDDEDVEQKKTEKRDLDSDSDLSDIDDLDSDDSDKEEESGDDVASNDEESGKVSEVPIAFDEKISKKLSKVVEMCPTFFKEFQVDSDPNPRWFKLKMDLKLLKVDLKSLMLSLFETTVISCVDGVDKALIISKENCFATEGYNNLELFKYYEVFDLNKFYSNNIIKMYKLYGIEAAASCIENEVKTVFKAYSIDVSSRHLRLIADYLSFSGRPEAFNRHAMKNHSSQIQRASFETALSVLNEMVVHCNVDKVKSPSANIMMGQRVANIGTNSMFLIDNKNVN